MTAARPECWSALSREPVEGLTSQKAKKSPHVGTAAVPFEMVASDNRHQIFLPIHQVTQAPQTPLRGMETKPPKQVKCCKDNDPFVRKRNTHTGGNTKHPRK